MDMLMKGLNYQNKPPQLPANTHNEWKKLHPQSIFHKCKWLWQWKQTFRYYNFQGHFTSDEWIKKEVGPKKQFGNPIFKSGIWFSNRKTNKKSRLSVCGYVYIMRACLFVCLFCVHFL